MRQHILSMLLTFCILLGCSLSAAAVEEAGFSDVPADAWYADAVNWAAANGIVEGFGNGQYGPEDDITREQLAVMLYRYAGGSAATVDLSAYPDASSVSSWAAEAMGWAVSKGILSGATRPVGSTPVGPRAAPKWLRCKI